MNARPKKYISIFSNREWGGFERCQNNICIGITVLKDAERHFHTAFCGTVWVPGHSRVRGNELPAISQERELLASLLDLNRHGGL
jgi:hypothetical protein